MSINQGTSLDMATINDPVSATTFVEDPGAQEFGEQYNPKRIVFVPDTNEVEDDKIKELQAYLSKPNDDLKILLGYSEVYNGPIDGKINSKLISACYKIEDMVQKLLNTKNINGIMLRTSLSDIKSALNKVANYKRYLNRNKVAKMNLDDRFLVLSKIFSNKI